MQSEIRHRPDFASVRFAMAKGESVQAEPGAMMGMSGGLKPTTNIPGGLLGAAKRALAGESVFLVTWTAEGADETLHLAPPMPGDIVAIPVEAPLVVQRGGFLAATNGVSLDAQWAGAKGFFSGEGLVMLRATGSGTLWLGSYGAISEREVDGVWRVDTGHIVAFDATLTWSVTRVGGWKSTFLSGEGLVVEFRGKGRVWFQTRSADTLAGFLHPFRRIRPKTNQ